MNHANMILYIMEKRRKKSSKQKWKNRDYHVQHNKDVENQGVKIYYATNQSPSLQFLGPHNKPHGVRGSVKHYHMRFYPKLVHVIYAIHCIHYACTLCTSILDQPWIPGLEHRNNLVINLSKVEHTGLWYVPLATGKF